MNSTCGLGVHSFTSARPDWSEDVLGRAAFVYSQGTASVVQGACKDWLSTFRCAIDTVPIECHAAHVVLIMGFTAHGFSANDMSYHQASIARAALIASTVHWLTMKGMTILQAS